MSSTKEAPLRDSLREAIHAINSPLGVILGTAQFVLSGVQGKQLSDISVSELEDIVESLQVIERQSQRCAELSQGMRSLIGAGTFESHIVDLKQCLDGVIKRVGWEDAGIHLEMDLPQLPGVVGHIDRLMEAFTAIARNAYDAMPEGGVLRITADQTEDELQIVFEDEGCGIAPESLEKVFSPFFSTSGESNRGWGLPLARLIFEAHGAEMKIESEGKGTRVSVHGFDMNHQP